MLPDKYADGTEKNKKQGDKAGTELVCNDCKVTLFFSEQNSQSIRKQVADLLVTAFERQIGVRETV